MGRSKEEDDSIYQSQYDDEDSNYSDHSTPKNIERIRNGDEVMNLPVVRSEIFFSSEFENENSQLSSYFAN